jgi:hypothetical protein
MFCIGTEFAWCVAVQVSDFPSIEDKASSPGEAVQAAANHDGNVSPVHCAEPLPVARALSLHVL